jgi:GNAT superfamily N-acetyltransferase
LLVWPINFSVWNTYRIWNFERNNEIVLWEYDNKSINKILLENNFKIYEKYITAKRDWKNPYILDNEFNDYKIKKINIKKDTFNTIYDLSVLIFTKAPKISFNEFEKYMQVYLDLYKNNISEFILTYKWHNIWFLSSFYTKEYFVIKTVWILREYRWKWLWNYLLSYVYNYYLDLGYNSSYYLYMREKWDALNMTKQGAEKYREYFTYYLEL